MDAVRSIVFNILYYGIWTPLICICMAPCLIFPRGFTVWVASFYQDGAYILEKYILNLTYEVRGLEHRPPMGEAYIAASKHYSAYETLKLYALFGDPTIVLKKELLSLPLFGWFLKKLDVIAIDRGNRGDALNSLTEGAKYMKEKKRPIVIYPQGTRVKVDETTKEKPYKGGIVKLYAATNLPIIPLATNSGLYWPRNSFWKKSGKVIFQFLPPIEPGLPGPEALKILEERIEAVSNALVAEGRRDMAA